MYTYFKNWIVEKKIRTNLAGRGVCVCLPSTGNHFTIENRLRGKRKMFPLHIKIKFRTWNRRRFKMIVGRAKRETEREREWGRGMGVGQSGGTMSTNVKLPALAILDACCHWCFVVHSSVFSLVMEFINISLCAKWVAEEVRGAVTRRVNDKWICACGHKECQQLP